MESTKIQKYCQSLYRVKQLRKFLRRGVAFYDLRIYSIVLKHFFSRSGIFSINELIDLLHYYGSRSLHRKPGNRRAVMELNLRKRLTSSILFRQTPDGRFIFSGRRHV